jgi:hypothetical protein
MENDLVLIFSSNKLYEIEIAKSLLLGNDIESYIVNKQDSMYFFGDIELYVNINEILRAKIIILKLNEIK